MPHTLTSPLYIGTSALPPLGMGIKTIPEFVPPNLAETAPDVPATVMVKSISAGGILTLLNAFDTSLPLLTDGSLSPSRVRTVLRSVVVGPF